MVWLCGSDPPGVAGVGARVAQGGTGARGARGGARSAAFPRGGVARARMQVACMPASKIERGASPTPGIKANRAPSTSPPAPESSVGSSDDQSCSCPSKVSTACCAKLRKNS
eukprot:COSAG02_NODE_282_length_25773_cov_1666.149762_6_plen_112_part_00